MDVWWWVPIGLAAWCLASVVVALRIGPVLRRTSEARESLDRQFAETSDGPVSPFRPPGAAAIPPPSGSADPYTLKRNPGRQDGAGDPVRTCGQTDR
jgi:hypothetical protein